MNKIDLQFSAEGVGYINFDVNPDRLGVNRTAGGFRLSIPFDVSLRDCLRTEFHNPSSQQRVSLDGIRGTIFAVGRDGAVLELGRVWDDQSYQGPMPPDSPASGWLTWQGSFTELAIYERMREGGEVRFKLDLYPSVSLLVEVPKSIFQMRTNTKSTYKQIGISFPIEVWLSRLRTLGVLENVLVEIPLPSSPPSPWDGVWGALLDARIAFERGGTTGWNECVRSSRLALERWRLIEREDNGQGWQAPNPNDLRQRSKPQRIDNIRWYLMQLAHQAPHTGSDEWTRDDALLMLSTLSSLLAERKP